MAIDTYSTGTVAIGATATSVVGTGSNWSGQNAMSGDLLVVAGNTVIVQDVTDALHLAIDAWPYAAVTAGAGYRLYKVSPLRFAGGQAMADVSTLVAALNTDGFYVFVGPDLLVPDPSYGNDNQYAFQATTGKLWQKTGGTWNFIGTYKGFGTAAPYDNAKTYNFFDVATDNGSSYLYINDTPSSGNAPPNATFWVVLAAKGDTGAPGTDGTNGTNGTDGATGSTGPAAWTAPAAWVTATGYVAGPPSSAVVEAGEAYVCLVPHTSGTFATDLAAGKWIKVAQKGSGDLLSTNNGSDFTDVDGTLDNLGGVSYSAAQLLNSTEQQQARDNIGVPSAIVQSAPNVGLNPTHTTSTTAVMMGMGGTIKITPAKSTRVKITIGGLLVNDSANGQVFAQIRFGTGTAPANGVAVTGTQIGTTKSILAAAANQALIYLASGTVSGLTLGTAYWFDVGLASGNVGGSGAYLQQVDYTIEEV